MQLLLSGLLYLSGVAVILWFKPALMFNENGTWKEFGIGRGERYTWLPFWMFAITWAMMSYVIVFSLSPRSSDTILPGTTYSRRKLRVASAAASAAPAPPASQELMPGYYMLNTPSLNETGVPRYVYVGERPPGM